MALRDHKGSAGLLDGAQHPDLPGARWEDTAASEDVSREEQDGQA